MAARKNRFSTEDYPMVDDALGVNRSTARTGGQRGATTRRRNNVKVDEEMKQCIEDIVEEK